MIQYGLTCISEIFREQKKTFKTITRKQFLKLGKRDGIKVLSERILHNVKLAKEVVELCYSLGISHYRIPESFPLMTEPTLKLSWKMLPDYNEIISAMNEIGITAKKLKIRIGSHPDQFVILCSNRPEVCEKSIIELNQVSWFFDKMGLPQSYQAPINIHPSCSIKQNDSLYDIADRFYSNLMKCDVGVQKRLTLENEDKGSFSCEVLYEFRKYLKNKYKFNLPLVFDNLHNSINVSGDGDWLQLFKETWPKNIKPVMHWSEGGENGNKRSHVQYISENVGKPTDSDVIWELEVKAKDKAIIRLIEG